MLLKESLFADLLDLKFLLLYVDANEQADADAEIGELFYKIADRLNIKGNLYKYLYSAYNIDTGAINLYKLKDIVNTMLDHL